MIELMKNRFALLSFSYFLRKQIEFGLYEMGRGGQKVDNVRKDR